MANAEVEQADGTIRARVAQGTQQTVGPLLIGVMGVLRDEDGQSTGARMEVRVHRSLGTTAPGIVHMEIGDGVEIAGAGVLHLAAVVDPPATTTSSTSRSQIFLELGQDGATP
ncbi:hypothetical protein [Brachybacterium sp. HMSC06H03]|uniref:hypothetical protein n=1 Tax=Brachybacterium sp. HMSC06H03 TaxID=1581127 RepID=UPI00114D1167|nr:hypothetical protein [Brachybacterium sp. HMSC06H03]